MTDLEILKREVYDVIKNHNSISCDDITSSIEIDYSDHTETHNWRFTRVILQLLQDDGIVKTRKEGSKVFFHIAQELEYG